MTNKNFQQTCQNFAMFLKELNGILFVTFVTQVYEKVPLMINNLLYKLVNILF